MNEKYLSILSVGYRATLEEQDDTVLWLAHTLRGAGCDMDIVLSKAAVAYAVVGQDARGLAFGARSQTRPPELARDVATFLGKGGRVLLLAEDVRRRGIPAEDLVDGVELLPERDLPALMRGYAAVWTW